MEKDRKDAALPLAWPRSEPATCMGSSGFHRTTLGILLNRSQMSQIDNYTIINIYNH